MPFQIEEKAHENLALRDTDRAFVPCGTRPWLASNVSRPACQGWSSSIRPRRPSTPRSRPSTPARKSPLSGAKAELALQDFDEAIRLDPDLGPAYAARGRLRAERHEYDPAIADLTAAIDHDADSVAVRLDRGTARLHRKDYQGAIADFDAALKTRSQGTLRLARTRPGPARPGPVRGRRGRHRPGPGTRTRFTPDPGQPGGRPDRAPRPRRSPGRPRRRHPETQAERSGDDLKTALFLRGSALLLKQDYARAIGDWEAIVKAVPNPETSAVFEHLGRAYLAMGRLDQAIAQFREAIRLDPEGPMFHADLARALEARGDEEECGPSASSPRNSARVPRTSRPMTERRPIPQPPRPIPYVTNGESAVGVGGWASARDHSRPSRAVDHVRLAGRQVLQFGRLARRPGDRDRVGLGCLAEPEGQGMLDRGEVALGREELTALTMPPALSATLAPIASRLESRPRGSGESNGSLPPSFRKRRRAAVGGQTTSRSPSPSMSA